MFISRIDSRELSSAYNILCQSLLPSAMSGTSAPFGLTYCEIPPSGSTMPHDHYDGEIFLLLSGKGRMRIGDDERTVAEGDLIAIPNHRRHVLENLSTEAPLRFLSAYWNESAVRRSPGGKTLILSAPPTPNGKLHLGHLSGPYLAADVMRRYLRLRGTEATHASGADENQTYVVAKSRALGEPPLAVAQGFTREILSILESFGAKPDQFLRPHADEEYREFVRSFFSTLVQNGSLAWKERSYPYCESCAQFVHESAVSGGCPHCGERTNGNGCEACGLFNDNCDLIAPRCNLCQAPSTLKPSGRYVFALSEFSQRLSAELAGRSQPARMKKYVSRLLSEGLPEVTVSFPYSWGIAAPQAEGQVIYEWLEMAAAYLYHAKKASSSGDYREFWVNPENSVHLSFGFDNSFFYLALVPALLWAFDPEIRYPQGLLTNFFYQLEGAKFSTSRGHAIWGDEMLEHVSPDPLRLYLATNRPEEGESNFSIDGFEGYLQRVGVELFDRVLGEVESWGLSVPSSPGSASLPEQERLRLAAWDLMIAEAELYYAPERQRLRSVGELLGRYARSLASLFEEIGSPNEQQIRVALAGLRGFAQVLHAVAPDVSGRIFRALGVEPKWSAQLDLPACSELKGSLPTGYFGRELARLRLRPRS